MYYLHTNMIYKKKHIQTYPIVTEKTTIKSGGQFPVICDPNPTLPQSPNLSHVLRQPYNI